MLRQFNLEQKVFSEPVVAINENSEITYSTSGEGWYAIATDDEINAISASITGGGAVWVENGKLKTSGKAPSAYHIWQNKKWVLSEELQAVKKAEEIAIIRDKINALRDAKINGGVYVEAVGKWIDTDATAERNILSVKASFDLFGDMEIAWTCADNSILMINKEKLMQIWQALMNAKTGNHANALRHKAALEQSENPADYDYSGGWTKCYQDYLAEQGYE